MSYRSTVKGIIEDAAIQYANGHQTDFTAVAKAVIDEIEGQRKTPTGAEIDALHRVTTDANKGHQR